MNTLIFCVLAAVCVGEVFSSYSHGYHGPTAIPYVLHDGHIADTHEVAAAKAEHFAAVAKAMTYGGYSHGYSGQYASGYGGYDGYSQDGGYDSGYYGIHGYSHHTSPYHGPLAKPVVLQNGYLADTHEVAAAKSQHFAAVAKAKAQGDYGHDYSGQYASGYGGYHGYSQNGGYDSGYYGSHGYSHHTTPYHGPLAKPVVLHSGYLADTHEVAAAKQHHLEAVHSGQHGSYGYY